MGTAASTSDAADMETRAQRRLMALVAREMELPFWRGTKPVVNVGVAKRQRKTRTAPVPETIVIIKIILLLCFLADSRTPETMRDLFSSLLLKKAAS